MNAFSRKHEDVWKIQTRLKMLGFDPGVVDGIKGRKTIRAVKAFQKARKLTVDSIVGPNTLAKLFGRSVEAKEAIRALAEVDTTPWMDEARRMEGVTEINGKRHNQTIMDWARSLKIWYPDDETPWCGLFVAHSIGSQLPGEPLPNNPLGARNWLKAGKPIYEPVYGAIVVFWRGKKSGWKGHVGFVVGDDRTNVYVLGGNQSNQVNIRKFKKDRVLGYRWPETALPHGGKVVMSGGHSTDRNEE